MSAAGCCHHSGGRGRHAYQPMADPQSSAAQPSGYPQGAQHSWQQQQHHQQHHQQQQQQQHQGAYLASGAAPPAQMPLPPQLVVMQGRQPPGYAAPRVHATVAAQQVAYQRRQAGPVTGAVAGGIIGCVVAGPVGLAIGGMVGALACANSRQGVSDPGSQLPLGVATAVMPGMTTTEGGVTFYAVDVVPDNGSAPWRVWRRYNDFSDLRSKLKKVRGPSVGLWEFPRKHFTSCTGARQEERRLGLQRWLQQVLGHPASRAIWIAHLRPFFEDHKEPLPSGYHPLQGQWQTHSQPVAYGQSAPHGQPAPYGQPAYGQLAYGQPPYAMPQAAPMGLPQAYVAQPVHPALVPPAPVPEKAAPSASQGYDDEGMALQIEIPAGISPGQYLGVTVPDGRELHFCVPQGATPGTPVTLWLDVASGTLTVLPP
eukprot:CAMPEP_0203892446 /NCGR_PEP_ID=MMETSP0359-20131031/35635_1 /ASSEMBLY_ACC=CAM_ASM_000338 /TAXON_ID=268821 /ORGANISM="Scrippsiella Hangoei, Strain SHTV-5" /LENGTH=425 /DNA_ID=CAMNT_0050814415 /DNA_START=62 /DNA_END=1339 /DNA_ORIENTATION=+